MKGGPHIDAPSRSRWQLALELIADGREAVYLGETIEVRRHFGWPGADGHVHIAVLDPAPGLNSREVVQALVDDARATVKELAGNDLRFAHLVNAHGTVWEYCGDDGFSNVADCSDISRRTCSVAYGTAGLLKAFLACVLVLGLRQPANSVTSRAVTEFAAHAFPHIRRLHDAGHLPRTLAHRASAPVAFWSLR